MIGKWILVLAVAAAVLAREARSDSVEGKPSFPQVRQQATKLQKDGNFKDAYEAYRKLALDPANEPRDAGSDLLHAIECLQSLGRLNEVDGFREDVVKAHADHWPVLRDAAQSYVNVDHNGFMVAGQFERGPHRGGGRYVNAFERDRIRSLQLMEQALKRAAGEKDQRAVGDLYLRFADMLLSYRGFTEAWRLQYLSDLGKLPDYDEGGYYYYYRGENIGAPVDEQGNPVYHSIPKSYESAASDGERWRWMLIQAMELDPGRTNEILLRWANFLHEQFDVQTMSGFADVLGRLADDEVKSRGSTYLLHTLGEDETLAKLATGIKRFKFPDEFNFIRVFQRVADNPKSGCGEDALNALASIFENRRQYDKAAAMWTRSVKEYGPGQNDYKRKRVEQIIGNWGQFEQVGTQPAGKGATVEYRFRNGSKVDFEAQEIDVPTLLRDVKEYLKSTPGNLDWERMNLGNIGWQLVQGKGDKYLRKTSAAWSLDLKPRELHFDKRITVTTPLQKPGAYWVTARMQNGNTSQIILWVDDTAIIKKPLDGGTFLFVADAVNGKPVGHANVECFGYQQQWVQDQGGRGHQVINISDFAEFTDPNGQIVLGKGKVPENYQWVITATTEDGRLAYLGFSGIWFGNYYDAEYEATKVYLITDRPVYRPKQNVSLKAWVRHAKYDQEDTSSFAEHTFVVRINDPKGEKIFEKQYKADAYGGLAGEYPLPADTTLGMYSVMILDPQFTEPKSGKMLGERMLGGGNFRVEEYKKPEFEVSVDAPTEPVMLGEKIAATVKAKYYFGAPVTKAKVKYKITRTDYSASWYPPERWDWLYGPGYWWFGCDYAWYRGWNEWGCWRPRWPWIWWGAQPAPEIVAENEVAIGADGTVKVEIDTALAKELYNDRDHKYEISAEVVDESRRTITGSGSVIVARKPFKVYAWVDRGYYRVGDVIQASFSARTPDSKPVDGKGAVQLFKVAYDKAGDPVETALEKWSIAMDTDGLASLQIKAARPGQYRVACAVTDAKGHTIEGGYVFVVAGEGTDGAIYRFNSLELVTDKKEYAPAEKVRLMVNTDLLDGTVLLFVRPANGMYLAPQILPIKGKSLVQEIEVTKKDMPNFFVEAVTVSNGKVYTETREIIVPPEKRVLNVEVKPSASSYKPGEKATVRVRLTDFFGKPYVGSLVMTMYDKAVEYVSGGSNVPEIRKFFWEWRRQHRPQTESSLDRRFANLVKPNTATMENLGVFGYLVADEDGALGGAGFGGGERSQLRKAGAAGPLVMRGLYANRRAALQSNDREMEMNAVAAAPMAADAMMADKAAEATAGLAEGGEGTAEAVPVVRTKFADTAFWVGTLLTDSNGVADVALTMPENLTGWKVRTWAMGHGTKVGEASVEVVTAKKLMLRLQAPRFFVEKDEVVLSANIHNYLAKAKKVKAVLELDGGQLEMTDAATRTVEVAADGEQRVDWRVKVVKEGESVVRMKALTDEESDAMEMRFPVYVHGMLKMDSYSGAIPDGKESALITVTVPKERRVDQSRLEVRYSPTLAGAMVDALPYLVAYPYGCTEQTLNRFLPAAITQKILIDMGLDLKAIKEKQTNLNAQEIGDDKERAKQWKRFDENPVFDQAQLQDIVKEGVARLTAMQLSDGGWGWFSGWGEYPSPHLTAYVVHGLQIARENDVPLVPGVLERGVEWLKNYQADQVRRLQNAAAKKSPWKERADDLDAFTYMVLVDAKVDNADMREFLYRDRIGLSVYAKAMYGLALLKQGQKEKLDMVMSNIEQFLVQDDENQTAYLRLPADNAWWCWYGSEYEAHAYYLKLLARTEPKSQKASRLVKYLLNNRKHATYWNSTRDTALCVEAMADYMKASGESKPDMTVEIMVDGRKAKEVRITAADLFTFDNKFVLFGDALEAGQHKIEFRKKGTAPLYFNAYLTNFTLEDQIAKAGLEVKVERKLYKLNRVDKTIKGRGDRGQAVDQRVEKYEREELANLAKLKSGDLVEIEMKVDSKNDYEYVVVEDMKAAGFEPVEVRSGYNGNDMGAFMELRDERVCFFVRQLARGTHSVSYRMRAEIPGKFSALPSRIYAMYAPELKGNSDEIKIRIED